MTELGPAARRVVAFSGTPKGWSITTEPRGMYGAPMHVRLHTWRTSTGNPHKPRIGEAA